MFRIPVSTRGNFALGRHLAMSADNSVCHRRGTQRASSGWRPGGGWTSSDAQDNPRSKELPGPKRPQCWGWETAMRSDIPHEKWEHLIHLCPLHSQTSQHLPPPPVYTLRTWRGCSGVTKLRLNRINIYLHTYIYTSREGDREATASGSLMAVL